MKLFVLLAVRMKGNMLTVIANFHLDENSEPMHLGGDANYDPSDL